MFQRASVGLDVHGSREWHARSTVRPGEGFKQRLCPDSGEILAWLHLLPSPVKVVYAAGRVQQFNSYQELSA